jgi:hypothetical protein
MNIIEKDIEKVVNAMRPGEQQDGYTPAPTTEQLAEEGWGAPYYMYGHRKEIADRLIEQGKGKTEKKQRYPLIALRLDILENNVNGILEFSLNIAIITETKRNLNAEERLDQVFIPILEPLYERFFIELKNSGLFMWSGNQEKPKHTKIKRYYWGTQQAEGNVKNIFADPLDAIEIIDLKISQRLKC